MRRPSRQTGASGETAVTLAFEEIGWGPIRNSAAKRAGPCSALR